MGSAPVIGRGHAVDDLSALTLKVYDGIIFFTWAVFDSQ
jgi:hypothetical protein